MKIKSFLNKNRVQIYDILYMEGVIGLTLVNKDDIL